jgi:pyruvate/2-oxoglutarate dehydrogenase complex dihydrolipoamide acyltransferase (E2) component
MRHTSVSVVRALAVAATLTWGLTACSDSKEDDEKLDNEAAESSSESGDKADAAEKAGDGDSGAATQGAADTAAAASAPATPAAAPTPPPVPAPAATTAATPAPAPSAPATSSRVVRYVNTDKVDIHGQPADGAPTVGMLLKGDRVMVVEENGWGRISDNMFIKLDQLSNRAVARDRQPAHWQPPTH